MDYDLSYKQLRFVQEYIQNNGNSTKAALKAYNVSTTNSAGVIGHKLLRNVKVQEAISRILEGERSVLSRTVDLLDYVSNNGSPHDQLKACQVVLKLYGLL